MTCDRLEPHIESVAAGEFELSADDRRHVETCPACSQRLRMAESIDTVLAGVAVIMPPAAFTAQVIARIGSQQWKTERAFDLGFNLALAAGLIIIAIAGAGLAWSLGLLTITLDVEAIAAAVDGRMWERAAAELRTVVTAAALLTMALGLWWWAEADSR